MLTEEAEVVAIDGDHAWVEAQRRSACGTCSASSGCGTGLVSRFLSGRRVRLRALNVVSARIGERVVVAIDEAVLLRGSFVAYIVPLATLFAGALAGEAVQHAFFDPAGEAVTILSAFAGLGLGMLVPNRRHGRMAGDAGCEARIVDRLVLTQPLRPHRSPDPEQ